MAYGTRSTSSTLMLAALYWALGRPHLCHWPTASFASHMTFLWRHISTFAAITGARPGRDDHLRTRLRNPSAQGPARALAADGYIICRLRIIDQNVKESHRLNKN